MKHIRKIPAIIIAISIAISVTLFVGQKASAANDGKLTITAPLNFTLEDQEFSIYRLFDIVSIPGTPPDLEFSYEITSNFEDFKYKGSTLYEFLTDPNLYNTGRLPNIKPLNSPEMFEMLSALWDYIGAEIIGPDVYYNDKTGDSIGDVTLIPNGEIVKSVVFENLPYGYYLIYGSGLVTNYNGEEVVAAIAAVSLKETDPEAEVILKVDAPELDKWIWNQHDDFDEDDEDDEDDEIGAWARWTDVSVGDTVRFKINSSVPNMRGYKSYTFTVHDVMSAGLTFLTDSMFLNDSIEVYVGGVKYTDYTLHYPLNTPHYIDQLNDYCTFEIEFDPDEFVKLTTGQGIEIFYSAVLNENAIIELLGNPNDAYLEYSSNPYDSSKTNRTPPRRVKVYTGILKLIKTNGKAIPKFLAGAKFELYDKEMNPVFFKEVEFEQLTDQLKNMDGYSPAWFENANIYLVVSDGMTKAIRARMEADGETEEAILAAIAEEEAKYITVMETPASGEIIVVGIAASYTKDIDDFDELGTYYLKEIEAPEWYLIIHDLIKVQVRIFQGKLFDPGTTIDDTYWEYSDDIFKEDTRIRYPLYIANESVFPDLPETGGIGRRLFIIGGIALMGLAVIGLVIVAARKKKKV